MRETPVEMPHLADWPMKSIDNVCNLVSRGTSPNYDDDGSVRAIGQRCIQPHGFDDRYTRPHHSSGDRVLVPRNGDVLLNSTGTGTIGRSCLFQHGDGFIVDGHVTVLRPGDHVDGRWLDILFRSPWGQKHLERRCYVGSTGQVELSRTELVASTIPVPSIAEQRRIAGILDTVDEQIAAVERVFAKESVTQYGLIDNELLKHADEYDSIELSEACLAGGQYGSNAPAVSRDAGLPRYVRITDIDEDGELSTDINVIASLPHEDAWPYILSEGDLLIARTGFTTGKSSIFREEYGLCAFAGYLVRFKLNRAKMLPEYAFLWTRGSIFKRWVGQNLREVGQRNISAAEYNTHPIPIPPLDAQKALIDAWAAGRDKKKTVRDELARLHTLKRALTSDLLTGKVRVPTQE